MKIFLYIYNINIMFKTISVTSRIKNSRLLFELSFHARRAYNSLIFIRKFYDKYKYHIFSDLHTLIELNKLSLSPSELIEFFTIKKDETNKVQSFVKNDDCENDEGDDSDNQNDDNDENEEEEYDENSS